MNYHEAIELAYKRIQDGHGTQSVIGKHDSYDFRVCLDSSVKLADDEYKVQTFTAWPTPGETELPA